MAASSPQSISLSIELGVDRISSLSVLISISFLIFNGVFRIRLAEDSGDLNSDCWVEICKNSLGLITNWGYWAISLPIE